jgi:uncharacterized protein (TIGR02266 family)
MTTKKIVEQERRKSLRVPVAARVRFKSEKREEVWFTEDIAEGGLFLKVESPPFIGTTLELEIALPGVTKLIRVKGDVVWRHEGKGCGIRFVRMTAEQRKTLVAFIESVEARP